MRPSLSLTQTAYETLRADLLACRLRPGERLRINDLCAALSVSLSAVREALSRLTAEGLVVAEPQRGFRVAPISLEELRDLTRVRIEIEGLCLKSAIESGDVAWESGLVAAFHQMSRTPERVEGDTQRVSAEWAGVHAAFHQALVGGCDSPWLLRLRALLHAQSERYRLLSVPLAKIDRDLVGEHGELVQAAIGRDTDRALRLMKAHLELTMNILLKQAQSRADDPDAVPEALSQAV